MRTEKVVAVAVLFVCLAACTSGKDKGGGEPLTSDMTGAVSLALSKPADVTTIGGGGDGTIDTSGEPFFTLVKIDGDGNIDPVFNQQRPIFWVEVNATHVAVSGDFDGVAAFVDGETEPQGIDCGLVVFPRTATGEEVKCLARSFHVGLYPANDPHATGGSPSTDYPGFTATDGAVFFTEVIQPNPTDIEAHVWKWSSGSDVIEEMLQLAEPFALSQPFAMNGGAHVCAMTNNGGHPTGEEALYCTPEAPVSWQAVPEDPSGFPYMRARVLGTNLLTGYSRVSLVDGTVDLTSAAPLPSRREHTILVGDTAWGLSLGIGSLGGDLVRATSLGGELVDNSVDWERIAGTSGGAYVYGASQLKRLDFATATLGTANLLGSTTLLQVTDMSLTTDDNIRLDGTTSTGQPAIVLVNTVTGAVTITDEDVPEFQLVTPLE